MISEPAFNIRKKNALKSLTIKSLEVESQIIVVPSKSFVSELV